MAAPVTMERPPRQPAIPFPSLALEKPARYRVTEIPSFRRINMTSPIVVFDLDGTLVDTAPDLLDSLNHTLVQAGLDPVEAGDFRRFVGQGARVLIEKAYLAAGQTPASEAMDDLLASFLEHYGANMPGRSLPYDRVVGMIGELHGAGFLTAICTNKTEAMAKRLLHALEIDRLFSAICGQDTFPVRKPDPAHLLGTIEMAGGDPGRSLMVGDSETDILTAKAAGIPVVAVDFGYTERHVREFGPDRIISHYADLDLATVRSLVG